MPTIKLAQLRIADHDPSAWPSVLHCASQISMNSPELLTSAQIHLSRANHVFRERKDTKHKGYMNTYIYIYSIDMCVYIYI